MLHITRYTLFIISQKNAYHTILAFVYHFTKECYISHNTGITHCLSFHKRMLHITQYWHHTLFIISQKNATYHTILASHIVYHFTKECYISHNYLECYISHILFIISQKNATYHTILASHIVYHFTKECYISHNTGITHCLSFHKRMLHITQYWHHTLFIISQKNATYHTILASHIVYHFTKECYISHNTGITHTGICLSFHKRMLHITQYWHHTLNATYHTILASHIVYHFTKECYISHNTGITHCLSFHKRMLHITQYWHHTLFIISQKNATYHTILASHIECYISHNTGITHCLSFHKRMLHITQYWHHTYSHIHKRHITHCLSFHKRMLHITQYWHHTLFIISQKNATYHTILASHIVYHFTKECYISHNTNITHCLSFHKRMLHITHTGITHCLSFHKRMLHITQYWHHTLFIISQKNATYHTILASHIVYHFTKECYISHNTITHCLSFHKRMLHITQYWHHTLFIISQKNATYHTYWHHTLFIISQKNATYHTILASHIVYHFTKECYISHNTGITHCLSFHKRMLHITQYWHHTLFIISQKNATYHTILATSHIVYHFTKECYISHNTGITHISQKLHHFT